MNDMDVHPATLIEEIMDLIDDHTNIVEQEAALRKAQARISEIQCQNNHQNPFLGIRLSQFSQLCYRELKKIERKKADLKAPYEAGELG